MIRVYIPVSEISISKVDEKSFSIKTKQLAKCSLVH